jgi:predicted O-methyltransferase YrrM
MKGFYYGYYATRVYLPLSSLSRRWRRFSGRIRGKKDRFLQATRIPEISWSSCATSCVPRVWEHEKENGNVRISELGILSAFAAECRNASNLFEVGTFDGRTTLNLALNAPSGCHIYTLDLPPDQATKYGLATGERHMVDKTASGLRYEKYRGAYPSVIARIHQLFGDSATFDYSAYTDSCSLVFVDGSHAYEYALADTSAAMKIVETGGIVVWHDYGIWEGVTQALEELEQREQLGLRNIQGTSLVFWKKK